MSFLKSILVSMLLIALVSMATGWYFTLIPTMLVTVAVYAYSQKKEKEAYKKAVDQIFVQKQ